MADETPRAYAPERLSIMSTTASAKTVRPIPSNKSLTPPAETTEALTEQHAVSTPNIAGIFTGATHHRADKASHSDDDRLLSLDGAASETDGHAEPSVAWSAASATGQVEVPVATVWEQHDRPQSQGNDVTRSASSAGHRRNRSEQIPPEVSEQSFRSAKEALLRQAADYTRSEEEQAAEATPVRLTTAL